MKAACARVNHPSGASLQAINFGLFSWHIWQVVVTFGCTRFILNGRVCPVAFSTLPPKAPEDLPRRGCHVFRLYEIVSLGKAEHRELVEACSALVSLYGDEATTPCLHYEPWLRTSEAVGGGRVFHVSLWECRSRQHPPTGKWAVVGGSGFLFTGGRAA